MPNQVVDGRNNLHPSRETYRSDRRWSTPTRTSYPPSVPRCSWSAVRAIFPPTLSGFAASCSTASSSCRSSSTVSSIDRRAHGRGVRVRAIGLRVSRSTPHASPSRLVSSSSSSRGASSSDASVSKVQTNERPRNFAAREGLRVLYGCLLNKRGFLYRAQISPKSYRAQISPKSTWLPPLPKPSPPQSLSRYRSASSSTCLGRFGRASRRCQTKGTCFRCQ